MRLAITAAAILQLIMFVPVSGAFSAEVIPHPVTGSKAGDEVRIMIKGIPVKFRWCPAGTFTMGSPQGEPERAAEETRHEVTLSQGFWLMETEVTQALWKAVKGPINAKFKGDDQPAEPVSWYEAVDFCNALSDAAGFKPAYQIDKQSKDPGNKLDEKKDTLRWKVSVVPGSDGFRLPTEAQWEYACRAGTASAFSFGDTVNTDQANYNGKNTYNNGPQGKYLERTAPVGSYPANPWGFREMHGNVWEWCWDWHGPYQSAEVTDPCGPTEGSARILRGGVWHYKPAYLRSAARYKDNPDKHWDLLGVRALLPAPGTVSASKPVPDPLASGPDHSRRPVDPVTQPGNGYDWMARHEAALALKSTLNPDVVFIGDSITHHWGGLPEGRLKLGEKVLKSAFPNHRILNLGFGSDRTQHVLWRLDHGELTGLDPKWVVINIGSNNTSDHNSPAEIMEGIKAVCGRVGTHLPHAKIILMSIFPRDEKVDCPRRKMIVEINRMIADYAKANGIVNLDIGDKFLDSNGSVRRDLLPDRCHPVEPGYRIWAEALLPYLDSK